MKTETLAFAIQILGEVIKFFSFTFRMGCEIENNFTSAQRLCRYLLLDQEDELIKDYDKEVKAIKGEWPSAGDIQFDNVTMRYRPGLEPSIRELSLKVQPKMKVGIVGRTGAGKSSISQALFRLTDIEDGSITIDGIDIKKVGLHALRANISYIPQ